MKGLNLKWVRKGEKVSAMAGVGGLQSQKIRKAKAVPTTS